MKLAANVWRKLNGTKWGLCAIVAILLAAQSPAQADGFKVLYKARSERCADRKVAILNRSTSCLVSLKKVLRAPDNPRLSLGGL
jgi:hypothetical protein